MLSPRRLWARSDRPLERPTANVADLLLHGAREWHDLHRDADQILFRDVTVREFCLRQGRYNALLDFGSRPAHRELRQLREIEPRWIDSAAREMNFEDFNSFVVQGNIDKEHLVETAFANHFGGKQVDAVCRCCDEKSPCLLLHPGEEERKNSPLLAARFRRRDAHLDLVE